MPTYPGAASAVRANLMLIAAGQKAPPQIVGYFTEDQFKAINAERTGRNLPPIESKDIVYVGRHHYKRRCMEDGYSIDDLIDQVVSALNAGAEVKASPKMTTMRIPIPRADNYKNMVMDEAVFECTTHKPHAELYSVIPKGDTNKPKRNAP